jgi:hypothetical protein
MINDALDERDRIVCLVEVELGPNLVQPDRALVLAVKGPGDTLVDVILEEVTLKGAVGNAALKGGIGGIGTVLPCRPATPG